LILEKNLSKNLPVNANSRRPARARRKAERFALYNTASRFRAGRSTPGEFAIVRRESRPVACGGDHGFQSKRFYGYGAIIIR
jgi:hypothetical protein